MPKVSVEEVLVVKTSNVQATHSQSPQHSRSESALAINPANPLNMVGASKRFNNPRTYDFTLAAIYSFDGGKSWGEAPPLRLLHDKFGRPWGGISDPALAWDNEGNVFLVALPFAPDDGPSHSIAVYKSSDGGQNWGDPVVLHEGSDDKQWAAGDANPGSPFYGNVYAVWDVGTSLCFARSSDHGATWRGAGNKSIEATVLADDSFSPEISVAADGTIYIVYWNRYSSQAVKRVMFVKSADGGESFTAPRVVANGITSLEQVFPKVDGWPFFPPSKFRVLTMATGCIGAHGELIVAWADGRQLIGVSDIAGTGSNVSRVYYRRSVDGGETWEGDESGQPLLAPHHIDDFRAHHFHPQLISAPDGRVGCAFYEVGLRQDDKGSHHRISTRLAVSQDDAVTFQFLRTVTSQPWDPAVGAPLVHGNPNITFIGEYFGLDASSLGFTLLWTDTRTGMQELFASTLAVETEYRVDSDVGGILFGGVAAGGEGFIITPEGKLRRVPPNEPAINIVSVLEIYEAAKAIEDQEERVAVQRDALRSISRIVERALRQE